MLEKFSDQAFTCEYKYDGERAQIHVLEDGTVKIYSRNSEDNTGKYPDIIAMFPHVLEDGVKSIVMDAEAVAYDPEQNKILPFQVLSTRARKSVTVDNVKVHVCVYAFDCLYLNGEALLKKSLTERRDALYKSVKQTAGKMELATAKTSNDVEELREFCFMFGMYEFFDDVQKCYEPRTLGTSGNVVYDLLEDGESDAVVDNEQQ